MELINNNQVPEGYKKTEVGVIPEDWEYQAIGEAFEIRNNLRLPISKEKRQSIQGKYPYYGPTNVQDYIDEYRVEGEHALIGEDGDHFLKWRDLSMTLLVDGKFNVNNHAHIIKGVKNLTAWFYYFFAHRDLTQYLKRQGAGRYKLDKNTLINIPCAIPPLPEQKAIAQTLSDVDTLIAALDKLIAKKRNIKTATMQQLLTGKTRLLGFREGKGYKKSEVGVIPEDWEVKQLPEIAWFQEGPGLRNWQFTNRGIKVINVTNLENGFLNIDNTGRYISIEEFLKTYRHFAIDAGDIVMASSGNSYSKVSIVRECDLPLVMNTSVIRFKPHNNYDYKFLLHYLKSIFFKKQIDLMITGGAQPNFGPYHLRKIFLSVPPLPEQQAIAQVLSDIDTEITALEKRRAKTQAIKQGMMQELLTGRTRLINN